MWHAVNVHAYMANVVHFYNFIMHPCTTYIIHINSVCACVCMCVHVCICVHVSVCVKDQDEGCRV